MNFSTGSRHQLATTGCDYADRATGNGGSQRVQFDWRFKRQIWGRESLAIEDEYYSYIIVAKDSRPRP